MMDIDVPRTPNEDTMLVDASGKCLKRGVECHESEICYDFYLKRVKNENEIEPEKLQPQVACSTAEIEESNIYKVRPVGDGLNTDIHLDLALNIIPIKLSSEDTIQGMESIQNSKGNESEKDDKETNHTANGCQSIEQCTMIRENRFEDNAQELYFCDYCTLKYLAEMRGGQKCVCEICGRRFRKKHHMGRHMELYHTSETDMELSQ